MKNRMKLSLLSALAIIMVSCSDDLVEGYLGDSYINFTQEYDEDLSTYFTFAYDPLAKKGSVELGVEIAANIIDKNRQYKVRFLADKSTAIEGVHFTKISNDAIFRASQAIDTLIIEALNDETTLNEEDKVAIFEIVSGGDFKAGIKNKCLAKVTISNQLVQPTWWDKWHLDKGLGIYSRKKFSEFVRVMKANNKPYNLDYKNIENMDYYDMRSLVLLFKYHLLENPINEEDGSLMSVKISG